MLDKQGSSLSEMMCAHRGIVNLFQIACLMMQSKIAMIVTIREIWEGEKEGGDKKKKKKEHEMMFSLPQ